MTEAATYTLQPIRAALIDWLAAAIATGADPFPILVTDATALDDPPTGPAGQWGYVVLDQLPGVRTTVAPMVLGSMLSARYLVTTVGSSRAMVGVISDRVRAALVAPDADGAQAELVLPGVVVLCRESLEDGVYDTPGGLANWTESFELDMVPGP